MISWERGNPAKSEAVVAKIRYHRNVLKERAFAYLAFEKSDANPCRRINKKKRTLWIG